MNFPSWELIFYVTPTLHECTMRFGHTGYKNIDLTAVT